MAPSGFEPAISAGERPQVYALDGAAAGIGRIYMLRFIIYYYYTVINIFPLLQTLYNIPFLKFTSLFPEAAEILHIYIYIYIYIYIKHNIIFVTFRVIVSALCIIHRF